jgi:hypothetical protein
MGFTLGYSGAGLLPVSRLSLPMGKASKAVKDVVSVVGMSSFGCTVGSAAVSDVNDAGTEGVSLAVATVRDAAGVRAAEVF